MSLVCLCVVENITDNSEIAFYTKKLNQIATHHRRGISFGVDWPEPVLSRIQKNCFIVNVLDSSGADNCELFLLPDGWYCNGLTNELPFRERMILLQDISRVFTDRDYCVELYLGQSGTEPEEFSDITVNNNELIDCLATFIGINGLDDGVHISITP